MSPDVLVVGAGIVGASCAWHLAGRGLDVVVVEREHAPAMGSTGRSAAGVRVQFTTTANIALSTYSLPVYRGFEGRYVPFDKDGLAGATYGPWDGVIDPHMATHAWIAMGRELGVRYRFGHAVTAAERTGDGWRVGAGGETFSCAHVVNAAGAWSAAVASLAGLDLPVGPKRIRIFLSAPVTDTRTYPLTIDLETGVYLRSEGSRVLFGLDALSQADNSPVIGPNPGARGWIDACGFSGHGIVHAPATGRAVSELVADGRATTVDVSAFAHERFHEGASAAVEANVF